MRRTKTVKIFLCAAILLFMQQYFCFAFFDKKAQLRLSQLYRYDTRQDNHELYANRLSLSFDYLVKDKKPLGKLVPFFEIRRNVDKDIWERKELGVEIGTDILPWLYLGQAIQKGWMKEDYRYYSNYEKRDYMETETRLLFSHNLLSVKQINMKGFILGEFTYDLDIPEGSRNELAVGLIIPAHKYLETQLNWRHIDRIHYYDSDVFEAAVTLVF